MMDMCYSITIDYCLYAISLMFFNTTKPNDLAIVYVNNSLIPCFLYTINY